MGTGLGAEEHKGGGGVGGLGVGSGLPPLPVCPHACCCPSGHREGLHAWGRLGTGDLLAPVSRLQAPVTVGLPGVVRTLEAAGPGASRVLRP